MKAEFLARAEPYFDGFRAFPGKLARGVASDFRSDSAAFKQTGLEHTLRSLWLLAEIHRQCGKHGLAADCIREYRRTAHPMDRRRADEHFRDVPNPGTA